MFTYHNTNYITKQLCIQNTNVKLLTINKNSARFGKKHAIELAIKQAKGELIVTTDADCIMGNKWLNSIVSFYIATNAKMIVAPVSYYHEKTIFEKLQSLEFMALMASTGGSLFYKKAIMCNGANLAYSKNIFNEVKGFENIDKSPSGDDVLLMYKIANRYPENIHFLKHKNAIVFTKAKTSLANFISQRKRWASKPFNSLNTSTKVVSIIVYLFNSLLFLTGGYFIFNYEKLMLYTPFFIVYIFLVVIKCFIDFLLLFLASSFFNKRKYLIYFLPEQILYIPYVFFTGIIGLNGTYNWKGRKNK